MSELLSGAIWNLPDALLLPFLTLRARARRTDILRFYFSPEDDLYLARVRGSPALIAIPHRRRLGLLTPGLAPRIKRLTNAYCLQPTLLGPDAQVVDCGANCGELGIWATSLGARYLGFEPDPFAYKALCFNVGTPNSDPRALSNRAGSSPLNVATARADSSLLLPEDHPGEQVTVQCVTLDEAVATAGIGRIRLLKVEAEGFEPEVLSGAVQTLRRTDYVAVDAGPERAGGNTAPQVVNTLTQSGFALQAANFRRGGLLFASVP